MIRGIGALWLCGMAASAAAAADRLAPPAPRTLPLVRTVTAVPALAPEALALDARPHRPIAPAGAFLSSYLAPQMSRRLAPLGEWFATSAFDRRADADVGGMEVRQNAEQLAWKATRRAVRSWIADRFEPELTIGVSRPSGASSGGTGTRVRFGVAGLRPRMVVERAVGVGALRFGLDATGDANLEWRPSAGATRLGATWDVSDRRFGVSLTGTF